MHPPTPTNKFKPGVWAGGEVIGWQHGDVGGEDRYGRYSTTYRIESPQKVGRVFYPAGHAPAGSDTGLAYAARQLRQDTIRPAILRFLFVGLRSGRVGKSRESW